MTRTITTCPGRLSEIALPPGDDPRQWLVRDTGDISRGYTTTLKRWPSAASAMLTLQMQGKRERRPGDWRPVRHFMPPECAK